MDWRCRLLFRSAGFRWYCSPRCVHFGCRGLRILSCGRISRNQQSLSDLLTCNMIPSTHNKDQQTVYLITVLVCCLRIPSNLFGCRYKCWSTLVIELLVHFMSQQHVWWGHVQNLGKVLEIDIMISKKVWSRAVELRLELVQRPDFFAPKAIGFYDLSFNMFQRKKHEKATKHEAHSTHGDWTRWSSRTSRTGPIWGTLRLEFGLETLAFGTSSMNLPNGWFSCFF